jgi:hypothetical protein
MFNYSASVGGVDLLGYRHSSPPAPVCDKAPPSVPSADLSLRESGITEREDQLDEVGFIPNLNATVANPLMPQLSKQLAAKDLQLSDEADAFRSELQSFQLWYNVYSPPYLVSTSH